MLFCHTFNPMSCILHPFADGDRPSFHQSIPLCNHPKIVEGAEPLPTNIRELMVVWNRGAKVSETTGVPSVKSINGDVYEWDERLSMLCTMYR